MTFTRTRDLIIAAILAGLVVNLLLRLSYGELPTLPQPAGTSLLVFAIAEMLLGNALRARIQQRPGSRPVQALTAAKAVALAKASSLAGAITAGGWLGVLSHVLPLRYRLVSAASDTTTASIGLICAAALVGGALWLEHCCRTPDDPSDEPNDSPGSSGT